MEKSGLPPMGLQHGVSYSASIRTTTAITTKTTEFFALDRRKGPIAHLRDLRACRMVGILHSDQHLSPFLHNVSDTYIRHLRSQARYVQEFAQGMNQESILNQTATKTQRAQRWAAELVKEAGAFMDGLYLQVRSSEEAKRAEEEKISKSNGEFGEQIRKEMEREGWAKGDWEKLQVAVGNDEGEDSGGTMMQSTSTLGSFVENISYVEDAANYDEDEDEGDDYDHIYSHDGPPHAASETSEGVETTQQSVALNQNLESAKTNISKFNALHIINVNRSFVSQWFVSNKTPLNETFEDFCKRQRTEKRDQLHKAEIDSLSHLESYKSMSKHWRSSAWHTQGQTQLAEQSENSQDEQNYDDSSTLSKELAVAASKRPRRGSDPDSYTVAPKSSLPGSNSRDLTQSSSSSPITIERPVSPLRFETFTPNNNGVDEMASNYKTSPASLYCNASTTLTDSDPKSGSESASESTSPLGNRLCKEDYISSIMRIRAVVKANMEAQAAEDDTLNLTVSRQRNKKSSAKLLLISVVSLRLNMWCEGVYAANADKVRFVCNNELGKREVEFVGPLRKMLVLSHACPFGGVIERAVERAKQTGAWQPTLNTENPFRNAIGAQDLMYLAHQFDSSKVLLRKMAIEAQEQKRRTEFKIKRTIENTLIIVKGKIRELRNRDKKKKKERERKTRKNSGKLRH